MHAALARRRRTAALVSMVIILIAACGAVLLLMSHVSSQELLAAPEAYVDVVVRQGDTLWHIARRHSEPGADVRRMVDRIRTANGLKTAVVRPGQVLKVPQPQHQDDRAGGL
ncbi:MAG: LysM peptidoglycan-binding domain-containing protein [Limnochordales bacterium]|nr:LysM peptidoglycan-binding domain-containing protein [Limnochordales bacterium]